MNPTDAQSGRRGLLAPPTIQLAAGACTKVDEHLWVSFTLLSKTDEHLIVIAPRKKRYVLISFQKLNLSQVYVWHRNNSSLKSGYFKAATEKRDQCYIQMFKFNCFEIFYIIFFNLIITLLQRHCFSSYFYSSSRGFGHGRGVSSLCSDKHEH